MKVVFLYTEIAEYFVKCCEALSREAEVHIFRWPVNKEAPFQFNIPPAIRIYDKANFDRASLIKAVEEIQPDVIVCSGWIDKDYLAVCKHLKRKAATVMSLDTHWNGTIKQWIAVTIGRFFLRQRFSFAWVPGKIQANYARKLGFAQHQIHLNFYCCDLERFNDVYTRKQRIGTEVPKVFIYTGRYYEFKGITDLWEAFAAFSAEDKDGWELWCLGTGTTPPVQHPRIRHFGFVQPSQLPGIMEKAGVFILPSRFEPWGVVVHEFAAAGFPMILSDAVGAKEAFLNDSNGLLFHAGDVNILKNAMKKMASFSSKELTLKSAASHTLAQHTNPEKWVSTVSAIYRTFNEN